MRWMNSPVQPTEPSLSPFARRKRALILGSVRMKPPPIRCAQNKCQRYNPIPLDAPITERVTVRRVVQELDSGITRAIKLLSRDSEPQLHIACYLSIPAITRTNQVSMRTSGLLFLVLVVGALCAEETSNEEKYITSCYGSLNSTDPNAFIDFVGKYLNLGNDTDHHLPTVCPKELLEKPTENEAALEKCVVRPPVAFASTSCRRWM